MYGLEPLDWAYSQSTGRLYISDVQDVRTLVAIGYSGAIGHQNRTESEKLVAHGPIPRGVWRIGVAHTHRRLGPVAIALEPADPKITFGRSGFYIHGDNAKGDRSASSGCIILGPKVRQCIESLRQVGIKTLVVVD